MKVRQLISDKEISLPIIFECTEVHNFKRQDSVLKNQHAISKHYQTSKLSCKISSKPLHINRNEK